MSTSTDEYKGMFEDAVHDLSAIDAALGIDPDEAGGAAPILIAIAELKRLAAMVDPLLAHCPDSECPTCALIVCPHACDLHFHHDGCPACAEHDAAPE